MVNVDYIGPEAEVEVPDARVIVKQGGTVAVPDDCVDGLLCQTDNWKLTAPRMVPKGGKA